MKIMIGLLALSLLSMTAVNASGGGKKKKKAKAQATCQKACSETQDCQKTVKYPLNIKKGM